MAVEVIMPRLTHDMKEGLLVQWLKAEGEFVEAGEPLFEIETDKAVAEVEAEAEGILDGVRCQAGDIVAIGSLIAYLRAETEAVPEPDEMQELADTKPDPIEDPPEEELRLRGNDSAFRRDRKPVSPIARRIACEHNIELERISGSGPGGRIVEADVRAYLTERDDQLQPSSVTKEVGAAIEQTRVQKSVAARMLESWQSAPHFVLEMDVDMSEAQRWHAGQIESGTRLTYTSLLAKAVAQALRKCPCLNAIYQDGEYLQIGETNLGVAMATEAGLVVPVIKRADALDVKQIQSKLDHYKAKSQSAQWTVDDFSDGTFTLSNLGMYGIDRFQAIINPPQVGILAAGRIRVMPTAVGGKISIRPMMTLKLSIDHRALDGASAAPFLAEVRDALQTPDHMV